MPQKKRKVLLSLITIVLLFVGLVAPHLNLSVWVNKHFIFDAVFKGITLIVAGVSLLYFFLDNSYSLKFSKSEWLFTGFVILTVCLHQRSEFKDYLDAFAPKLTYVLTLYLALKALLALHTFEKDKVLAFLILSIFLIESIFIFGQATNLIFNTNKLFRIGGSYGHPGYSAGLMGMLTLFLVSNISYFGKNKWMRIAVSYCVLVSLGFSFYTLSRTGILLNLFALVLWVTSLLSNKMIRLAFVTGTLFLLSISLLQFKKNSSSGRIFIWKNSFNMLAEMPLMGYGVDSFSSKHNRQQTLYFSEGHGNEKEKFLSDYVNQAYNEFIQVTVEMGYPGLLIFILFIFVLLIEEKGAKSDLKTYPFILGYVFTMCFWSSFRELPYLLTFFTLIVVSKTTKAEKKGNSKISQLLVICFFLYLIGFAVDHVYETYLFRKNSALGNKNLTERKFTKAARFFHKAIEHKKSQVSIVRYGIALNSSGKTNEAVEFLKTISGSHSSPDYFLLLGDLYFQDKNYVLSERYYLKAHYNVPSKITPLYKLAKAFVYGNKKKEADSLVKVILDTEPKVKSTATIAMKEELRYLIKKMDTIQVKQ